MPRTTSLSVEQLELRELCAGLRGNVYQNGAGAVVALNLFAGQAFQQVAQARSAIVGEYLSTIGQQQQALAANGLQIAHDAATGDHHGLQSNIQDAGLLERQSGRVLITSRHSLEALANVERQIQGHLAIAIFQQQQVLKLYSARAISAQQALQLQTAIVAREFARLHAGDLDKALLAITNENTFHVKSIQTRIHVLAQQDGPTRVT